MSYDNWLDAKRITYRNAVTDGKTRYEDSGDSGPAATAYLAMLNDTQLYDTNGNGTADKLIDTLLPPSGDPVQNTTNNATAFFGDNPNASEAQILALEAWLDANPTHASALGLRAAVTNDSATGRKVLGGGNDLSHSAVTEKRKWKGNWPGWTWRGYGG